MAISIYKKGQGKVSRYVVLGTGAVWAAYGANQFYGFVLLRESFRSFSQTTILGAVQIGYLIAAGVFLVMMAGAAWMANHPKLVDFLIDTEHEMKKVSWPSRNEVVASTVIVLVFVAAFSLYMYGMDWVILEGMDLLLRK